LAALGDPRLAAAVEKVKQLNRHWMNYQLKIRFVQQRASWLEANTQLASHPAVTRLDQQITALR
jgi:hypothetical protein